MTNIRNALMQAAGSAGGDPVYVEDVFSTHLYTGNNANNHEINNGVDLADKGGLVWFKKRSGTGSHWLVDSERGGTLALRTDMTAQDYSQTGTYSFIQSFDDDGFTMGDQGDINNSSDFVSWTFAKQAGFFDVVKFSTTSGGGTQAVSHNLGSIPGYIIIKKRSATQSWLCWAKNQTSPNSSWWRNYGSIDNTSTMGDWGDDTGINSAPTSTTVTLGSYFTGGTADYVMYVFAEGGSDDQIFGDDGDEAIIKCGTFTTGATTADFTVDCGFEVGWGVFIRTNDGGGFLTYDEMRGFAFDYNSELFWNNNNAEGSETQTRVVPTATGFANLGGKFETNSTYQYIVIRRGPMKEPDAGTDVFNGVLTNSDSSTTTGYPVSIGFPIDWGIVGYTTLGTQGINISRLGGASGTPGQNMTYTYDNSAGAATYEAFAADSMTGYRIYGHNYQRICYGFRRYPKVFDVVCWGGAAGTVNSVSHNLTVKPELVILKYLGAADNFYVYTSAAGVLYFDTNSAPVGSTDYMGSTTATALNVTGLVSNPGNNPVAYLFATLAGVSKVGSVSHSGSTDVDCGFSGGARFVMVKRTDSTGNWYYWDTIRGIVAGDDPYMTFDTTDAQVTNTDYIDPLSSGFTLTSNFTSGTYIFLAFA